MLSPIAIGYIIWCKCEACEPGHVVGGYNSFGKRKVGQSRSQCMQHLETSTCVYFEMSY